MHYLTNVYQQQLYSAYIAPMWHMWSCTDLWSKGHGLLRKTCSWEVTSHISHSPLQQVLAHFLLLHRAVQRQRFFIFVVFVCAAPYKDEQYTNNACMQTHTNTHTLSVFSQYLQVITSTIYMTFLSSWERGCIFLLVEQCTWDQHLK